jgi:DNA replication licensing factor MCM7
MADDTPQKGESYAEDPAKFYEAERARCRKFLERFRPESLPGQPREALKYMMRIQEVRRDSRAENRVINIELNDVKLMAHDLGGDFLKNIEGNTLRYIELFSSVVDDILRSAVEAIEITPEADAAEILRQHREAQIRESQRTSGGEELTADQIAEMFPPQLTRRYELRVVPLVTERSLSLREVTSKHLGRLVQVTATVLRVTDVKPLLEVGCSLWCVVPPGTRARRTRVHARSRAPDSSPTPLAPPF